ALRAVHGEADLLPGYFVDRYGDLLAVQHLAEWAEVRRDVLARMAAEACGARGVVARDDGSSRDFELLPRRTEVLLGSGQMTASPTWRSGPPTRSSSCARWTRTAASSTWWCWTRPRLPSGARASRARCAPTRRSTTAVCGSSPQVACSSPAPAPAR